MLCVLKFVSARLCQTARSRSLCCSHGLSSYEYSPSFSKYLQERNFSVTLLNNKGRSTDLSDESSPSDSEPPRLTAKWKWVVRGKYKVAAFSADNNPAVAITDRPDRFWHTHKCSNCETVYEHTHPYGSLHHPQHIKDCPQCRKIAPADVENV